MSYQHYYPQHYPQYAYAQQPFHRGPLFTVEVQRHTGMLLAFQSRESKYTGTYEQCLAELKRAQTHNLTAGWWSPTSLFALNAIALLSNRLARRILRRQATEVGVL